MYTSKKTVTKGAIKRGEIAEKKIAIAHKAAKPIVSLDRQEGKTIVTLTGTTEGADIPLGC